MNCFNSISIPQLATLGLAVGMAWLSAQESTPPAEPATAVAAPVAAGDKWAQIKTNNETTLKDLEELEKTIDFIRIRAMRGGRGS